MRKLNPKRYKNGDREIVKRTRAKNGNYKSEKCIISNYNDKSD